MSDMSNIVRDIARGCAAREIASIKRPGPLHCLANNIPYKPPTKEEIDELLAQPDLLDRYLEQRAKDFTGY